MLKDGILCFVAFLDVFSTKKWLPKPPKKIRSVSGSTGWFVVAMGQYGAVLVGTWWYWASIKGCAGWYVMVLGQHGTGSFLE